VLKNWIEIRNKEFKGIETTALFVSQMKQRLSVDAVGDMLAKYCAEAGIKRITPHKLRATAACMLAKNGLPVKAIAKQLGHSGVNVTMRYIDVFKEDEEKVKNILDGLI
jgi:integrase